MLEHCYNNSEDDDNNQKGKRPDDDRTTTTMATVARVRRNGSTIDNAGPGLATELSDKLLKVRQREQDHRKWLGGLFLVFIILALGGAHRLHVDVFTGTTTTTPTRPTTTTATTSSRTTTDILQRRTTTTVAVDTATTTATSSFQLLSSRTTPNMLDRAIAHYEQCRKRKDDQFDRRTSIPYRNHSLPALPAFGVLDDFVTLLSSSSSSSFAGAGQQQQQLLHGECSLPPATACEQTQLTVIFLAYNPDRLDKMYGEMIKLNSYEFVAEIVLVWNGERNIHESADYAAKVEQIARIVYPIRDHGLPNDLLNRYHPTVLGDLQTNCLLYYDDDGPFYSQHAIWSALELWKRYSRHQIGAMARHIRSSTQPSKPLVPDDTTFTPYCANDTVTYEFRFFANYDAHMVLPSGSLFHRNYLCYIWHDSMKPIRQFVLDHPVHPDDMTVSMLISQLAGVAPKVYSRRLRAAAVPTAAAAGEKTKPQQPTRTTTTTATTVATQKKKQRRLMEEEDVTEHVDGTVLEVEDQDDLHSASSIYDDHVYHQYTLRRRLAAAGMGGVCWDCGSGMTEQKEIWAYLRTEAIASLVRYFGSLTTGSIGWCDIDSSYYRYDRDGRCVPDMAELGTLSWMKADGSPRDQCP